MNAHRHRIRLPAPWKVQAVDSGVKNTVFSFHRNFQLPTGLTQQSRVSLEVALLSGTSLVALSINHFRLSPPQTSDTIVVEIARDQLRPVNEITIQLSCDPRAHQNGVENTPQNSLPRFGIDLIGHVCLYIDESIEHAQDSPKPHVAD